MKKVFYLLLLITAMHTACKKGPDGGLESTPTDQKADLPAGAIPMVCVSQTISHISVCEDTDRGDKIFI